MPKLANVKHEAFARAVATGESASDAYRAHVSRAAGSESTWMAASRLRNSDKVAIRIQELRAKLDETGEWIASQREILAYCTRALRTPLIAITDSSDLCQERTVTITESGSSVKIKSIDKLGAVDRIAKIKGYYREDQTRATEADAVSQLLATVKGWGHPNEKPAFT